MTDQDKGTLLLAVAWRHADRFRRYFGDEVLSRGETLVSTAASGYVCATTDEAPALGVDSLGAPLKRR
jgi:hypothetical protein